MQPQTILKVSISIALAALTWAVFGQTLNHDFINYDDNTYVYDNSNVEAGVTLNGLKQAFTHFDNDNWHPLTTISHMVDCQLFGLRPSGHHFTNVLLHTTAVILLFLVLNKLTGSLWPSSFVAALFAIHPLHVESVAWIAERKDVLSAVFFMLTLGAYQNYTRKPIVSRYIALLVCFVLGLMSKPMFVTVPFILLLVDWWPLRRVNDLHSFRKSIIEKIPLLLLSVAGSIATIFAQRTVETRFELLPWSWRIGNALHAYIVYIGQLLWPVRLGLIYPHPGRLPFLDTGAVSAVLIALTLCAFVFRRRYPYVLTGWFWYLVMLLPVIGLVQVGIQGHADRYTYLPQIGLYIVAAWSIADLSRSWPHRQLILSTAGTLLIALLTVRSWTQTAYWKDSETLMRRTLAVTGGNNDVARMSLGEFLLKQRRLNEAIAEFRIVLEHHPNYLDATFQLGSALAQKGELDSAIEHFQRVLTGAETVRGHCALGETFLRNGNVDDAIAQYRRAFKMNPLNSNVEGSLANILLENGRGLEAIAHYRRIVRHNPSSALANFDLAVGLHRQDQLLEAIAHYRKALSIQRDYPEAEYFLNEAIAQEKAEERARFEQP